jgi:arsenate reductase (glutaredoxin)
MSSITPVIKIYGITNCDTVKKSRVWFDSQGLAYEFHDFKKQGVPQADLRRWASELGWEALINKKGTTWRKLDDAAQSAVIDANSAVELMLANSSVIKRPVTTQGSQIALGFCPEAWEKFK